MNNWQVNKYIVSIYSYNDDYCAKNDLTLEEYKELYNSTPAYVILLDEKIITKGKSVNDLYRKGLTCGCFIDCINKETPKEVKEEVEEMIKKYDLKMVSNSEFKKIESLKQKQRTKKAFGIAEDMIRDDEWEM